MIALHAAVAGRICPLIPLQNCSDAPSTRQVVKSWDAYKVTLTLVHRNPNPRSGTPSRYSVPPTPFYRIQQQMPAPRVSGLGGTCS